MRSVDPQLIYWVGSTAATVITLCDRNTTDVHGTNTNQQNKTEVHIVGTKCFGLRLISVAVVVLRGPGVTLFQRKGAHPPVPCQSLRFVREKGARLHPSDPLDTIESERTTRQSFGGRGHAPPPRSAFLGRLASSYLSPG